MNLQALATVDSMKALMARIKMFFRNRTMMPVTKHAHCCPKLETVLIENLLVTEGYTDVLLSGSVSCPHLPVLGCIYTKMKI